MSTQRQQKTLEEVKVNLKLQLATLWAVVMFLYIYVDYLHLYMPEQMEDILKGRVFVFEITKGFLSIAFASMTIPALMVFLSVALPAKANRQANIIIAALYIPYSLFNLAGHVWVHMALAAVMEIVLLCVIICYAWKWPCIEI